MERRCSHDIVFQILSHCLDQPRTFSNIVHTLELSPKGAELHIANMMALRWLAKTENTYQTTFRGQQTYGMMRILNSNFALASYREQKLLLTEYIFPERHEPLVESTQRIALEKAIHEQEEFERLYPVIVELAKKKGLNLEHDTMDDLLELFEETKRLQFAK
jgi:hypothetical protein